MKNMCCVILRAEFGADVGNSRIIVEDMSLSVEEVNFAQFRPLSTNKCRSSRLFVLISMKTLEIGSFFYCENPYFRVFEAYIWPLSLSGPRGV